MQQINLLDAGLLKAPPWLTGTRLLLCAGLLGGAVAAHALIETSRMARVLAAAALPVGAESSANAEHDPSDKGAAAELAALEQQVLRSQALRGLLGHPADAGSDSAGVLAAVIGALPASAWLTEIEIGTQRKVRIGGRALDAGTLPGFAARLEGSAALRGVAIETVEVVPPEAATDGALPTAGDRAYRFVLASQDVPAAEAGR
jgi:hypothetical protein